MKAKLIPVYSDRLRATRPLPIVYPQPGREPQQGPDEPIVVRYLGDREALGGRTLPWTHPDRTVPASMPRKQYDALPVGEWDGDEHGNITSIREEI